MLNRQNMFGRVRNEREQRNYLPDSEQRAHKRIESEMQNTRRICIVFFSSSGSTREKGKNMLLNYDIKLWQFAATLEMCARCVCCPLFYTTNKPFRKLSWNIFTNKSLDIQTRQRKSGEASEHKKHRTQQTNGAELTVHFRINP